MPDRRAGDRLGRRLHGFRVGAAVGLAVLVLVATAGLDGLTGERLRIATADGIRTTLFVVAGGIALTLFVGVTRCPTPAAPADSGTTPVASLLTELRGC